MSKKTSEWKEEFLNKFGNRRDMFVIADILAFISDLLAKEKMEMVERIEEGIRQIAYHFPPYENSIDDQMDEKQILDYLEDLKSEEKEEVGG